MKSNISKWFEVMDTDQSFDEDDEDDEEEEEEDIRTSKKRPASSPAIKSQVCPTNLTICVGLIQSQMAVTFFKSCRKKLKWKWRMMTTMKMTKKMRMMSECRFAHAANLFSKVASNGFVIQQWVKT